MNEKVYETKLIAAEELNGGEYCSNCDCNLYHILPIKDVNDEWRCSNCGCLISFAKNDTPSNAGGCDV